MDVAETLPQSHEMPDIPQESETDVDEGGESESEESDEIIEATPSHEQVVTYDLAENQEPEFQYIDPTTEMVPEKTMAPPPVPLKTSRVPVPPSEVTPSAAVEQPDETPHVVSEEEFETKDEDKKKKETKGTHKDTDRLELYFGHFDLIFITDPHSHPTLFARIRRL